MSINAVLTSDKANFQNYFPDGIVIPERANMALTKLGMDIPVIAQNTVNIPLVPDPTLEMIRVEIDGIVHNITWREFYTAWTQYPDPAAVGTLEPAMTENNFFGIAGTDSYQFWTNNSIIFDSAAGTPQSKPPFTWCLARAIENKFQFYSCRDITEYETHYSGIQDGQTITGNAVVYDNSSFRATSIKRYGLNVSYNSSKISNSAFTAAPAFSATELNGFGFAGNLLTSTVTAAPARVNMAVNNDMIIDPNGGYVSVRPNIPAANAGFNMAFGLSLEGQGSSADDEYNVRNFTTLPEATTCLDIGVQFETFTDNAGALKHVYKIIDGQKEFVYYDGAAAANLTLSNFKPNTALVKFDNDADRFYILMRRGDNKNNTNQFIFEVLHGTDGEQAAQAKVVYTATRYLDNADIIPTPIFFSDNVAGNIFQTPRYIEREADSRQEGSAEFSYRGGNIGTFKLSPATTTFYDDASSKEFWGKIGFMFNTTGQDNVDNTMNFKISTDGTQLNKSLYWKQGGSPQEIGYFNNTDYYLGVNQIREIYFYDAGSTQWKTIATNALTDIPKYLNVYLTNQNISAYTGSANLANTAFTQQGEDRLLCLVPFDTDITSESGIAQIRYETFNPYYRPLNNPISYKMNDFIVEISVHDPNTNNRFEIKNLAGILKMGINITKSVRPNLERITRHNDLVPII